MPIYEYKCQQCGVHFEKRQSVSDEPLTTCEKCHGKLEKQWSLSGFQFKGAGWYVTDYAGKGKGSGEKSGGDSKPVEGKSEGSTADAKKDTKKGDAPASTPAPKTD